VLGSVRSPTRLGCTTTPFTPITFCQRKKNNRFSGLAIRREKRKSTPARGPPVGRAQTSRRMPEASRTTAGKSAPMGFGADPGVAPKATVSTSAGPPPFAPRCSWWAFGGLRPTADSGYVRGNREFVRLRLHDRPVLAGTTWSLATSPVPPGLRQASSILLAPPPGGKYAPPVGSIRKGRKRARHASAAMRIYTRPPP